ncbi:MAG: phosphoenolpyruvate-utilizing N-terminal domain-containing protein, partial [Dongiaceae bacterium]
MNAKPDHKDLIDKKAVEKKAAEQKLAEKKLTEKKAGAKRSAEKKETHRARPKRGMQGRHRQERQNLVLDGLGVSGGIGIGEVHVVEAGEVHVPEYEIAAGDIEAELARFMGAREKAERQLKKLKTKSLDLHGSAAEEMGFLLDAHLQMLSGSRVIRGVEQRIRQQHQNAEAAVQAEISKVAQEFAALGDAYLAARASDVREVGSRLLRNLTKTPYQAFQYLPSGSIVVAEELTPSDT